MRRAVSRLFQVPSCAVLATRICDALRLRIPRSEGLALRWEHDDGESYPVDEDGGSLGGSDRRGSVERNSFVEASCGEKETRGRCCESPTGGRLAVNKKGGMTMARGENERVQTKCAHFHHPPSVRAHRLVWLGTTAAPRACHAWVSRTARSSAWWLVWASVSRPRKVSSVLAACRSRRPKTGA